MRKSEDVTIAGVTYTINQLGALDGHKLYAELALVLAEKPNQERLVGDLFKVPGLVEAMAKQTLVHLGDKKPQLWSIFDSHFAGEYEALGEWLTACIRINFQSRKAAPLSPSNGE